MPKFHVQRSSVINASPDQVYATVVDYSTWTSWSPWLCAEPDAKVTISENPSSVGSTYAWDGELIGAGEIEHQELQPGQLIREEIRISKPFRSRSEVLFELQPFEDGTKITWHMYGALPWFLFWMKTQMEVLIGMDYDRGLRMLKEWIETGHIQSTTQIVGIEPISEFTLAGVRRTCLVEDIGPSMDAAFAEAEKQFQEWNLPTSEGVAAVYHKCDMIKQTFDYTSGYVLPETSPTDLTNSNMSIVRLPAGKALKVVHTGAYQHLGNGWSAAHQYVQHKKVKPQAICYEVYLNHPEETPPGELITEIYLPLK